MGDPTGIGPEILRAAIARVGPAEPRVQFVIYGDPGLFEGCPAEFVPTDGPGAAREAIERSAADLATGAIDAVVTGPVGKATFGGEFPGHTELYAQRLNTHDFAMMLAGPRLRVVPVTTHVALRDVAALLTVDELVRIGRLVDRSLRRGFGIARPRLAFAGLNPHAGDGGLFGDEEERLMKPAVSALQEADIDASGPWSPDTVFHKAVHEGAFDAVVCGYHDQALIPFKLLHFADGVNVTLGLPRPRTSPDHGPAWDIAGRGVADPTSMIRALELAIRLSRGDSPAA